MLNKKVIVVDDHLDTCFLLRSFLQMQGLQVETFQSAVKALQYLAQAAELPALVLVDMSMPEMDGAQFTKAVRSDPRIAKLKIVMLSGWDDLHRKEIDANEFVQKPVDLSRIKALIAAHLK